MGQIKTKRDFVEKLKKNCLRGHGQLLLRVFHCCCNTCSTVDRLSTPVFSRFFQRHL